MRKFWFFIMILCLFAGSTSLMAQDGIKDLRWAKSLMEKGDYSYAIEKFEDIARSPYNSPEVKKEAMYYVGYCHVKNNDPWQAVRVFERFLEKYDDGFSRDFIPDALYVLGRVYEETGDKRGAIKVYQRCKRNYPNTTFARKSAERLQELNGSSGSTDPFDDNHTGGGNHDDYDDNGGHSGHNYPTGISRDIRQLLRIAETVTNSFTRDQMLLEGSDRAKTAADFVALAKAINNDFTRGQLIEKVRSNKNYDRFDAKNLLEVATFINNSYMRDQFIVNMAADFAKRDYVTNYDFVDMSAAMNNDAMRQQLFDAVTKSSAFKVMSALTVIDLAKTCQNSYIRDQLLLTAAQKNYYSYRDLRELADACSNSFTKTQILQIKPDNDGYHHHSRNTAVPPELPAASSEKIATDPFAGFSFNKAQLKRVENLINAVENKKDVKKAVSQLKKSDLGSFTVREYMEKFRTLQKFDEIHNR